MIMPSTCRKILVLAILFAVLAPAWAQPRKAVVPPPSQQKEFERQWKEVQAKDPLVAVAYMELAVAALARTTNREPVIATICSNPTFAKSPGCTSPGSSSPHAHPCPHPCKPAQNKQDIEDSLSCWINQVSCNL
jgi:hypothetical protein